MRAKARASIGARFDAAINGAALGVAFVAVTMLLLWLLTISYS
jgi:hypothetical protein